MNKLISYLIFHVCFKITNKISVYLNRYYLHLKLIYERIEYKSMPLVKGQMYLKNKGQCYLGANITFNNTFLANPIGLYKNCTIYVETGARLYIDDNSGFSGVSIFCSKEILIGKTLFCGGNVSIWDTDFHPLNANERRLSDNTNVKSAKIEIGDDVFIGANSIILKGVTIGARAVIGAGSVVTKNIPADEIWAGNPIKFIRYNN